MTPDQLLATCQDAGIVLEARGDRLHVDAPTGVVTPRLREELAFHKAAVLMRLKPPAFTTLTGGLVVPAPALLLALDLERRGFRMWLDQDQQFQIDQSPALSEADRAGIDRWRLHLGAIVGYDADAQGRTQ